MLVFTLKWRKRRRVSPYLVLRGQADLLGAEGLGCAHPVVAVEVGGVEDLGVEAGVVLPCLRVGAGRVDALHKTPLFFECSLCLSRACLGKMIIFIYKLLQKGPFSHTELSVAQRKNPIHRCVASSKIAFM